MSIFARLGRFADTWRWWVVGGWAVILLLALPFAPRASSALQAGGFSSDSLESAKARAELEQELGAPPSALVVVLHSDTLCAGQPAFEAQALAGTAAIGQAPHVVRVVSHLLAPRQVSTDGHTAYDVVFLDFPPDDSPKAIPILEPVLRPQPDV